MLDIKLIRTDTAGVKKAMQSRGVSADIDAVVAADEAHRHALAEMEEARALQNAGSKGPVSAGSSEELKSLKNKIKELQAVATQAETALHAILATLPNIPLNDTPVGKDARDNVVISEFGTKPEFSFTPKHYMDLNERLSLIDTETAADVSGARFGYLLGDGARLEFALMQYALSKLTEFSPIIPPVLIRPEMMKAMGFTERAGVERGSDDSYYLPKDDLYLVGTSEQSIGPFYAGRMLDEKQLPIRHLGFSTCFRRESGAAGKDTRGILRVHQFDKLEMFTVCAPEASNEEHRFLLACQEKLMQGLGLHYRVVQLCTGDIGQASAATFDIETWMPGQGEYRETHSTSNTTDYQSRALKTRFRKLKTDNGKLETEFVHMLNGTAFAMPRMIIAILEQFQNEDGTVRVPVALRPFMGGRDTIS